MPTSVSRLAALVCCLAFAAAADDWQTLAERSHKALRSHYWNEQAQLFRSHAGKDDDKAFDYWWQAHALGAMADAVGRSSRVWSRSDLAAYRDGILRRNGKRWTNDFYDDEGWMTCSLLTAAAVTGDKTYHEPARLLWDDISMAWNDTHGGGIPWKKDQRKYKNAPANGPAIFAGAAFYRLERKPEDLAQAKRIHAWLMATLRDPATGFIWDGINRTGDGTIDKGWRFTYNQGITIGACLELWRATSEKTYLEDAERTGEAALGAFFDAGTNLCTEDGKGDGGLFKGILVQHLPTLAQASPKLAPRIRTVLEANGRRLAAIQNGRDDALIPGHWAKDAATANLELSVHLSGVMLAEALVRLDRPAPDAR